jgi:hypothetical protein
MCHMPCQTCSSLFNHPQVRCIYHAVHHSVVWWRYKRSSIFKISNLSTLSGLWRFWDPVWVFGRTEGGHTVL